MKRTKAALRAIIRAASRELSALEAAEPEPPAVPVPLAVPLAERRLVLIEFLRRKGGATRREILRDTAMPEGSLSALLTRGGRDGWLTWSHGGIWRVTDSESAGQQPMVA